LTLNDRLWKAARRRVMEGLGLVQGAQFRSPRGVVTDTAARAELDEYLRERERTAAPPPEPAPPHPYTREYRLLGVPVGADLAAVQKGWRRLVRETHPDRFPGDEEGQRKAAERLRRINKAYERLRAYLETAGS